MIAVALATALAIASGKSPMAVVQQQIDAYNAHNLSQFVACYAPDAVVYDATGGESRGSAAIRTRYAKIFAADPNRTAEIVGTLANGNFVAMHEHLPSAAIDALVTYEVRDGLITRVWLFP